MNAARFFKNFGHLANAPGGIDQIRQLIMATALMGRLAPPNEYLQPDVDGALDASRSSYLAEIGKKEKPLLFRDPLISEFDIPPGWSWKRVGELCDLQTGATPSRRKPEYFGGDIRWLVSGDINLGEIFECDGRITQEGLDDSNCKIIPPDSVLIALNGQGKTRATVALLRVPASCNQSLVAMIPFNQDILVPEYLHLSLKYRYFEIRGITGQNQRRGLNMGLVSELSVPLAPIEEQNRIVAKVDELMTLCDKLEAQQQERERRFPVLSRACHARFADSPTLANLKAVFDETGNVSPDDLRNTILALAVQGTLLQRSASDEQAIILLEFLKQKRSAQFVSERIRKRKSVTRKKRDDWPFHVPDSWEFPCFDDVTVIVSGVTKGRNLADRHTITLPYLRVANVQRGYIDLRVIKDIEVLPDDRERYKLTYGDVLMTEGGDWDKLGRAAIWKEEIADCIHQNHIYRVSSPAKKRLLPEWITIFVNSPVGRGFFENAAKQTTNLASINMTQLRGCPLPLPPTDEQRQIVARVDQLLALVDQLEEQNHRKSKVAASFAQAAVSAITGTENKEPENMKAPKTELVSRLQASSKPKATDPAPLAGLLAKNKGELAAKTLWQQSGLEIDAFYQQLRTEMANGWIVEPEKAVMKEVEAN